ncbi:MAG: DUF4198 domain-containing protein [Thermanaerothrix sp.]|nr:DUF4198 domain-containing protein [Thermanaerothrix sp.]
MFRTARRLCGLLAITVAMTVPSIASAHGVWIGEQQSKMTIILGEGAANDAYDPSKVKWVRAYGDGAGQVPVEIQRLQDHVVITKAPGAQIITLAFDHGYWSQDSSGKWHNKPKSQINNPVGSGMKALKFSTSYVDPSASPAVMPDLDLQVVPSVNPLSLKKGDSLKVRVLLHGKPVKGASLYPDFIGDVDMSVKTDDDGYAIIRVPSAGLNVIGSKVNVENPDKSDRDGEKINYFATLVFNLQKDED